jgi:hypothetical protein
MPPSTDGLNRGSLPTSVTRAATPLYNHTHITAAQPQPSIQDKMSTVAAHHTALPRTTKGAQADRNAMARHAPKRTGGASSTLEHVPLRGLARRKEPKVTAHSSLPPPPPLNTNGAWAGGDSPQPRRPQWRCSRWAPSPSADCRDGRWQCQAPLEPAPQRGLGWQTQPQQHSQLRTA